MSRRVSGAVGHARRAIVFLILLVPGLVGLARRHVLFTSFFAAGFVLRALVQVAYQPAIVYFDSLSYVANSQHLHPNYARPLGYPFFLSLLPIDHDLSVIPFLQHLMGLGVAVLIYALLLRLGVRRWLAAVAAAPLLLDAYQLNIEQYILSEPLYGVFIAGACALVLWRRPPPVWAAGLAGLAAACAALVRAGGVPLIAPLLLGMIFLRTRWLGVALAVVAFAAPILGYSAWVQSEHHVFGLTTYQGRFLYARVAPFADCRGLDLPKRERVLCPKEPVGRRLSIDGFMWSKTRSPVFKLKASGGKERSEIAGDFAKRIILHQPGTYAHAVFTDFARVFYPLHMRHHGELPISRWQFQTKFVKYKPGVFELIRQHDGKPEVKAGLAKFLREYQRFFFTYGPLLLVSLIAGLLAMVGVGRARRSGLRAAAFVLTGASMAVYVPAVAVNQFTWRYALPLIVLLPPAGAVGITALTWKRREESEAPEAADAGRISRYPGGLLRSGFGIERGATEPERGGSSCESLS